MDRAEDNKRNGIKTVLTDLRKLGNNYFDASISNAGYANNSITHLQNGLLTITLAELAFIGATDLSKNKPSVLGIISAGVLIVSTFSFMLGTHSQWRHVIKSARNYFKLSKDVTEFISKTGIEQIVDVPEFLSDENAGLKTSSSANIFFIGSILGVFIASILIFIHLIGLLE